MAGAAAGEGGVPLERERATHRGARCLARGNLAAVSAGWRCVRRASGVDGRTERWGEWIACAREWRPPDQRQRDDAAWRQERDGDGRWRWPGLWVLSGHAAYGTLECVVLLSSSLLSSSLSVCLSLGHGWSLSCAADTRRVLAMLCVGESRIAYLRVYLCQCVLVW